MSALLSMGGYGVYVWSVYGLSALVMGGLALASWRRHRQLTRLAEKIRAARRKAAFGARSEGV